jgi:DNA-binding transcriptional LysR family regulator
MQIRLLTRTTRSVSVTAAGERLLQSVGHRIDEIEAELDMLTAL